jgi:hypothetical protein
MSTFAIPFEKRVSETAESSLKNWSEAQKNKNFQQKVWKFKKNAYLCIPVRKTGPRKRN